MYRPLLSLVGILCFIVGCSSPSSTTVPSSAIGTITGTVMQADTAYFVSYTYGGATIRVLGSNLSTVTDSFGHWRIDGVPNGTYAIEASMPGYGPTRQYDVQVVGPGLHYTGTLYLGQIRNIALNIDSLTFGKFDPTTDSDLFVHMHIVSPSNSLQVNFVAAISTDSSDFSPTSAKVFQTADGSIASSGSGSVTVFRKILHSLGYHAGQTLYVATFTKPYNTPYQSRYPSEFFDPELYRQVYTGLGPRSNVLSFVLP